LPYASSLCGACYEVCPVKINIPEILIHLRAKIVERGDAPLSERLAMKAAAFALATDRRLSLAQSLARAAQIPFQHDGVIDHLPGMLGGWTAVRDLQSVPRESFRQWWLTRRKEVMNSGRNDE
jgi:L-lactate dehydrogenase complex protein LldF